MALLGAKPAASLTTSVFEAGEFSPIQKSVDTSESTASPPKPLLIFAPTVNGTYPTLLFLHGTLLQNKLYSALLLHVSSHGFIAVSPQLYESLCTSGEEEIQFAAQVTDWLSNGLEPLLPENVKANLDKLAIAGHSRGGKAAFALQLGKYATTTLNFSALLGVDPVAGPSDDYQIPPAILTYESDSFNLGIPVMVLGTGLGPEKKYSLCPPCAPKKVSHEEFFNESKAPCFHFVTKDYGHTDMLDDERFGCLGSMSHCTCLCKSGQGDKDLMRRCVGGIIVAFLRAYLEGKTDDLDVIVANPDVYPVIVKIAVKVNEE